MTIENLPPGVRAHTLSNGLQLIGEPRASNQSAAIAYFVKTGARDEVGPEAGVSHFLEHMMFKGTKKRSSTDITFELGNIGAQANAYTSEESTVFYGTVLPEYFSHMQELLSDMLRPSLDENEFSTEKKVILEEIALYQDRPQFCLFEQALQRYFDGHTAGNSVLGSIESISAVTRNQMKSYFDRRYSPANMALIAAGNFNWDRFVENAESLTREWKPFETGRVATPFARKSPDNHSLTKKGLQQSHLLLVSEGPSAQDPLRFPMTVISVIIGDGSGSKLYWKLVESGLAETAVLDCDEKDGTGCTFAYAVTDPDSMEKVAEELKKIIDEPMNFSDEDLERAKSKLASRIVMSGELPIGRLMSIGNDWLYRGSVTPLKETVAKIKGVSRKAIQEALERYPFANWSEYRMNPED